MGVAAAALVATGAGAAELQGAPVSFLAAGCDSITQDRVDGPRCLTNDNGTSVGFKASQSIDIGVIETFATLSLRLGNAFTPERLVASDARRIGESNRVMIAGMTARLLDDRITLSTQMGWSEYFGLPFADTPLSGLRPVMRAGSARLVKLDVRVVESASLRWSVAGELSDVSDDFFIGQAMAQSAQLALPGRRLALSSALSWKRTRLIASYDDYRSRFGDFATTRFGASRNGISFRLKSGSGNLRTRSASPLLTGRTESRSWSLEFDLYTMLPTLTLDESLPASLIPKHLQLGWRGGSSDYVYMASRERFARHGLDLYGIWETPLGETSLGYWRDRRIGASAELGQRDEQVVQLSHMVRKGAWRFGVDAMRARSSSTRGSGLADRSVSFGGSVAYDAPGGPRLLVQLGRDQGLMRTDDDSFLASRQGQQVSATLDLTDYLRKRFDRPDLRLKIDYRKQLDRSTTAISAVEELVERWTDGYRGEGLLVSFGMKL